MYLPPQDSFSCFLRIARQRREKMVGFFESWFAYRVLTVVACGSAVDAIYELRFYFQCGLDEAKSDTKSAKSLLMCWVRLTLHKTSLNCCQW